MAKDADHTPPPSGQTRPSFHLPEISGSSATPPNNADSIHRQAIPKQAPVRWQRPDGVDEFSGSWAPNRDRKRFPLTKPTAWEQPDSISEPNNHGDGSVGPVEPDPTYAAGWEHGLVAVLPVVGPYIAGIRMWLAYDMGVTRGPIAEANARSAANWGMTYLCLSALTQLPLALTIPRPTTSDTQLAFFVALLGLAFAVTVVHLVLVFLGFNRARHARVLRVPVAIPFKRTTESADGFES